MLTDKSIPIIMAVFLRSLFLRSKTSKPKPAPDESPATVEPKLIAPFKNIIVIKTETAQFGIKPKIPAATG